MATDLTARRAVWTALACLLVGGLLGTQDRRAHIEALARSPYDPEELDDILLWEVYPACVRFRARVLGVGLPPDPTLLEQRILSGPSLYERLVTQTYGRCYVALSPSWLAARREIESIRNRS
jgi:hypothetical protein